MEFIPAKQILSSYQKNNSWFGTNYTMNIYRGCCHGCIYCDSRSSCYQIENFDTVRAKKDALILLENELRSKRKKGVVATGSMSDPYNPFEKKYKLTRGALEILYRHHFGVAIATKSHLIERDIDILSEMKNHAPVIVKMTITTLDDTLAEKIEPNVALPSKRLEVISQFSKEGVYAGILLMPVLSFIEDNEENIKEIIYRAKEHGVQFIYPFFGVTLRDNQRDYFFSQLDQYFYGIKKEYIHEFKNAYECRSKREVQLWQMFKSECDRLKVVYKMPDIIKAYQSKYQNEQLSLF